MVSLAVGRRPYSIALFMLLASCGPEVDSHFELWRSGRAVEFDRVSRSSSETDRTLNLSFSGSNDGSSRATDTSFRYTFTVELDRSLLEFSTHGVTAQLLPGNDGPSFISNDGHHPAVRSVVLHYHWLTVGSEYRNTTQGTLHISELGDASVAGNVDLEIRGSIPGGAAGSTVFRVRAAFAHFDGVHP